MARKSSKTAHVMNLLSGGESESSKTEAAKENHAASQAAESKGTINELTVLAQQASIQMQDGPLSPSPISIIDLSSSVPDPVAEQIRQQLEEDEKREEPKEIPQDENNAIGETEDSPVIDTEEADLEEVLTAGTDEPQLTEEMLEPSEHPANIDIDTDIQNPDEENDSDSPNTEEPVQSDMTPALDPVAPALLNFKYLNVMEHVVDNIAREYMDRLGGCTCEHCIADVTALTLNKLSPKYVVVEPPAASPMLNFYSSRFAPQVIVELTKSCLIVKENPHH
ncbi:late competence development ComFB family protein [Clostridium boliviensis]|uniref:Late competence development ComFB family protein n=1 Tax=Clostridium boliviensis TaxID=318465 RepID=A0ABU4GKI5_9CLOT|nr:late competence development ComFB family protein [Clostridium boliviensis]MDW2798121.1 late competence development ComFB family protein [Clostridium boliviensis]